MSTDDRTSVFYQRRGGDDRAKQLAIPIDACAMGRKLNSPTQLDDEP
jgi:hypothetical protein